MKRFLVCSLLMICVLMLSACGNTKPAPTAVPTEAPAEAPAEGSPAAEPAAAEEPAAEPKAGGSITIAISQDLDQSLDPHTSTSAGKREIFFNIFEGLVKADPDGNFVPALAESWEVSDDATTFTFKIRKGVKFHNGSDLTVEDVVYTLDKCRGAESGVDTCER